MRKLVCAALSFAGAAAVSHYYLPEGVLFWLAGGLLLLCLPAALLLAVLLTGCTGKIEHIEPNSVEQIAVESLPQSETWARTYTDRAKIGRIVSYLNGLQLWPFFTENPDEYAGQALVLTVTFADGTVREFTHFGNMFFREGGGAWQRMAYAQAVELETPLNDLPADAES